MSDTNHLSLVQYSGSGASDSAAVVGRPNTSTGARTLSGTQHTIHSCHAHRRPAPSRSVAVDRPHHATGRPHRIAVVGASRRQETSCEQLNGARALGAGPGWISIRLALLTRMSCHAFTRSATAPSRTLPHFLDCRIPAFTISRMPPGPRTPHFPEEVTRPAYRYRCYVQRDSGLALPEGLRRSAA